MRITLSISSLFFAFLMACSWPIFAEQEAPEELPLPVNIEIEDTAKRVIQLLRQPDKTALDDSYAIEALQALVDNDADKYLVGFIEGAILFHQNEYQQCIDKLEDTKRLAEKIPDAQANSAVFRELHAILEKSYIQIDDYDHAFVEKKKYLIRMFDDREALNEQMNLALEKKFKIEQKNKAKELLEEQSRLKKLQILEAEQQKSDNERDTIILICIAIVFILLVLRQLNIRRRLLWLAQIDSLTSIKNRASLFEDGKAMFEEAKSGGQSLSIILLDIDEFKQVNDQYGHSTGDKALIQIAKLGNEVMKSRDVFARLGGEEFVALLPSATLDEAKSIAVRLKDKIAQAEFYTAESNSVNNQSNSQTFHLTASIGVAQYQLGIEGFDDLIKLGDHAMYVAKSKGRNQVATAKEIALDK